MATLQALPGTVALDATGLVLFSGLPNRAVSWSLTGAGTLSMQSTHTGANGQAIAKYTPDGATTGVVIVTVTYGT